MPDLKLWYSPGASSLAPHILLHEAGLAFEAISMDVVAGFPESSKHLNPKGRVPILSLDGAMITEIPAIATAISQLASEKRLMGRTDLEVVRVYEWLNWLSGTVHAQNFGALLRPRRYTDEEMDSAVVDSIRAKAKKNIEASFDEIEGKMKVNGRWVVDDQFMAVDAFIYVFFRWAANTPRLAFDMKTKYPGITALAAKVASRDSTKRALEVEGVPSMIPSDF